MKIEALPEISLKSLLMISGPTPDMKDPASGRTRVMGQLASTMQSTPLARWQGEALVKRNPDAESVGRVQAGRSQ